MRIRKSCCFASTGTRPVDTFYEVPAGRLSRVSHRWSAPAASFGEETGCTADRIDPLMSLYTTPGFTDELIHLFLATGLTRGATAHEADEFVEVETLTLSRALEMIERGEIRDSKTVVTLLFARGIPGRTVTGRWHPAACGCC